MSLYFLMMIDCSPLSSQNNAGKLGGQHDRSSVNLGGQIHNLRGQPFFPLNLYIIYPQKRSFLDLHRK